MQRFQLVLVALGFMFVLRGASGQEAPASPEPSLSDLFTPDPLEPAPESLVLDNARLFREREAAQLSMRLREFASTHDILIYAVAYSVLIGETIDQRASRLKDKWLSGKRGIVVVYQRGSERMTFSSTADPINYLHRTALQDIFGTAYAKAADHERGSSRVIAAVNQLMAVLPDAIAAQQNSNQETASETRGFISWSLAGLVVLAAGGMVAFQFLRGAQAREAKTYTLPSIRVPTRLGAPYSGGHQAELNFREPVLKTD